ncbi:MAG: glycoside hydrolase family protein [Actinomycetota bacterium]|nr:glycoside hydrolase family protein [Actinomycetota bacterium]
MYSDPEWLAQLYQTSDTASLYFDVVAVHPYPSPSDMAPECPPTTKWRVTAIERVRDTMVRNNDAPTPIWITELGWSSHDNLPGTPNWQLGVSQQEQADFAVRALDLIATRFPYVKKTFWYEASDTAIEHSDAYTYLHENNFGLLRRDQTPKPAYTALRDYLADGSVPRPASGYCD